MRFPDETFAREQLRANGCSCQAEISDIEAEPLRFKFKHTHGWDCEYAMRVNLQPGDSACYELLVQ